MKQIVMCLNQITFRKKLQDLGVNLSLDYYVIISIANIYCISLPNA